MKLYKKEVLHFNKNNNNNKIGIECNINIINKINNINN